MTRGRVLIRRTSERDIKMRDLYVLVDSLPEETLTFGRELSLEVDPGDHRVRVTNRLFNDSVEFTVESGQTVHFQSGNISAGCLFAPLMVLGGAGAYRVFVERDAATDLDDL